MMRRLLRRTAACALAAAALAACSDFGTTPATRVVGHYRLVRPQTTQQFGAADLLLESDGTWMLGIVGGGMETGRWRLRARTGDALRLELQRNRRGTDGGRLLPHDVTLVGDTAVLASDGPLVPPGGLLSGLGARTRFVRARGTGDRLPDGTWVLATRNGRPAPRVDTTFGLFVATRTDTIRYRVVDHLRWDTLEIRAGRFARRSYAWTFQRRWLGTEAGSESSQTVSSLWGRLVVIPPDTVLWVGYGDGAFSVPSERYVVDGGTLVRRRIWNDELHTDVLRFRR